MKKYNAPVYTPEVFHVVHPEYQPPEYFGDSELGNYQTSRFRSLKLWGVLPLKTNEFPLKINGWKMYSLLKLGPF